MSLHLVPPLEPVPTKVCSQAHPNDPTSSRCRICERRIDPAAEVREMVPTVVAHLVLDDGSAVAVANRLVIGRSPIRDVDTDILTVAGPQVSRSHAIVETTGWQLRIRDLDSTNGTFITRRRERGRRRVPSHRFLPLQIGETVHFGSRQALLLPPSEP
jgi:hypothetical protein